VSPKRREGPVRNSQTQFFYFDQFIGIGRDSRRVRVSLHTKDPGRARFLWEQEHRRQWSKYYGLETPGRPEPVPIAIAIGEFIEYEKGVRKVQEWRIFDQRLKKASDFWGAISLEQVDHQRLMQLDAYLAKAGRSEYTRNHYFGILKTLFNWAIKAKKFSGQNPILEIKPYTVDSRRRAYSAEELGRILAAAEKIETEAWPNATLQKHARAFVLVLLFTGMRVGELLNLGWENVQGDKIVLRRTETKQRREKVIPLTPVLRALLEGMRGPGPFVIPRPRAKRLAVDAVASLLKKLRKYSGIPDFFFHGLRHTAATRMVSEALGQGVGLADIMKVLGHSRMETTLRYQHEDFARMKKAVEILGESPIIKPEKKDEKSR
jgi:integrase